MGSPGFVKAVGLWALLVLMAPEGQATERHYYVCAVDIEWDYVPSGHNLVEFDDEPFIEKVSRRVDRIGSQYTKVVYRGFTDASFRYPLPGHPSDGLLGPTIRGETGDVIYVHFRNLAHGGNFSMHPHGFQYRKNAEGALYIDGTAGYDKLDDGVPPGESITYTWYITGRLEPTPDDNDCIAWAYHSHNMAPKDIDGGTGGFLLTCRHGVLREDGSRKDVDREILLWSDIADETNSHYFERNVKRCGNPALCQHLRETRNEDFLLSNRFYHINGFSFGNTPDFEAFEGERVVWYFMSLNLGVHTIHINGQTMISERRRVDTVIMISAIFLSGHMTPINPGRWLVDCRNQFHFRQGMKAFLRVKPAPMGPVGEALALLPSGKVRKYFIAAEEVLWNYTPGLRKKKYTSADRFLERTRDRIGSVYKKAVYRAYTDDTFMTPMPRGQQEEHYGISGPPIKAEVGDTVLVVFLNRATRPYSILANGVAITKGNEGAVYKQNVHDKFPSGAIAEPGSVRVYEFTVPKAVAPTTYDKDCITSTYHSAVDFVRDIYSGLFGPLLVCKPGTLDKAGRQRNVNREFFLNWMVIDENLSWYIDQNIALFLKNPMAVDKENREFRTSNQIRAINGRSFGTLKGLHMCLGDTVAWHMYGLGERSDHHHFGFDGNNFRYDGRNIDTASVFPGIGKTILMVPDQVGRLSLRNQQLGYEFEGMFAFYDVLNCKKSVMPTMPLLPRLPHNPKGIVRRYFIAAVEGDWDYCPATIDPVSGGSLFDPESNGYRYVRNDPKFVGSVYAKALYRQFTDESFTKMKPVTDEKAHLGMLGPFIKGNIGDIIEIVFKNKASYPYSLIPRNLVFLDGSPITDAPSTPPGTVTVYRYVVPARSGPGPKEPNCVASIYSSRVNPMNDTYSGLFGPVVICREGVLDNYGTRTDNIKREFAVSFSIVDENRSNYVDYNIRTRAPLRRNRTDEEFVQSNQYYTMNGYIYGNLPGLVMNDGDHVAWYIFAIGSTIGIHSAHFHGQIYLRRTKLAQIRDVLEVYPGTYETVEMMTDNPGTWLFHCHVSLHAMRGMKAVYTILPKGAPIGSSILPPSVQVALHRSRYKGKIY